MFILYTVAPILYRMASSAYYNLSLLSSDFYGLLFGLFLYVSVVSLRMAYILTSHRYSDTTYTGYTSLHLVLLSWV